MGSMLIHRDVCDDILNEICTNFGSAVTSDAMNLVIEPSNLAENFDRTLAVSYSDDAAVVPEINGKLSTAQGVIDHVATIIEETGSCTIEGDPYGNYQLLPLLT